MTDLEKINARHRPIQRPPSELPCPGSGLCPRGAWTRVLPPSVFGCRHQHHARDAGTDLRCRFKGKGLSGTPPPPVPCPLQEHANQRASLWLKGSDASMQRAPEDFLCPGPESAGGKGTRWEEPAGLVGKSYLFLQLNFSNRKTFPGETAPDADLRKPRSF